MSIPGKKWTIVPPWDNGHGDTVYRVHHSNIIPLMLDMEAQGYGGYCEASLVEPESTGREQFIDLTYDLRV